jgi:hypothetical protein
MTRDGENKTVKKVTCGIYKNTKMITFKEGGYAHAAPNDDIQLY